MFGGGVAAALAGMFSAVYGTKIHGIIYKFSEEEMALFPGQYYLIPKNLISGNIQDMQYVGIIKEIILTDEHGKYDLVLQGLNGQTMRLRADYQILRKLEKHQELWRAYPLFENKNAIDILSKL